MICDTEVQAITLLQPLVRAPFSEWCLSRYSIGESFWLSFEWHSVSLLR